MTKKTSIVKDRMDWLIDYARLNGGVITLDDGAMGREFIKRFPETISHKGFHLQMVGYDNNPAITRAARLAYKAGLFKRRTTMGHGDGFGRCLGFANLSVGYFLE